MSNRTQRRQKEREQKKEGPDYLKNSWVAAPLPSPHDYPALGEVTEAYKNDDYLVLVIPEETYEGEATHLVIQRHDAKPIHDWSELQQIKNTITDPLREGIEFYPNEALNVEKRNLFHIYVLPENHEMPFGLGKAMEKEARMIRELMYR